MRTHTMGPQPCQTWNTIRNSKKTQFSYLEVVHKEHEISRAVSKGYEWA